MPAFSWIIRVADQLEQGMALVLLLPLAVGLRHWPRLTFPLRVLAAGLACLAGLLALSTVQSPVLLHEGLLWHIYTIVQTLFLGSVYYWVLSVSWQQRAVAGALLGFLLFALFDWGRREQHLLMHAYTHTLQSVLLLSFGGLYFYQLARSTTAIRLEYDPLFLVTSGIVMYFSGTALLYVFIQPLLSASDTLGQHMVSLLVSLISLLQYGLFALAFYRAARPSSLLLIHE